MGGGIHLVTRGTAHTENREMRTQHEQDKVTMRDKKKIIDYLASPVGEAVFVEIEGKDDGARRRSTILNTCSRTPVRIPLERGNGCVGIIQKRELVVKIFNYFGIDVVKSDNHRTRHRSQWSPRPSRLSLPVSGWKGISQEKTDVVCPPK